MTNQTAMPELPISVYNGYADGSEPLYTAEQMHDYALAAIEAISQQGEPVAYQYRMRPTWLKDSEGWTDWTNCSAESYEDRERFPIYNDWQTEVRKLYAAPPQAEVGQQGEPVKIDWADRIVADAAIAHLESARLDNAADLFRRLIAAQEKANDR